MKIQSILYFISPKKLMFLFLRQHHRRHQSENKSGSSSLLPEGFQALRLNILVNQFNPAEATSSFLE